jgi:hypothetical protein
VREIMPALIFLAWKSFFGFGSGGLFQGVKYCHIEAEIMKLSLKRDFFILNLTKKNDLKF